MGGHQSKTTLNDTTNIITHAILKQVQNCVSQTSGKDIVRISGNNNVIKDVDQSITISVNQKCVNDETNKSNFNSKVANSVAQTLSDSDVALTQWADGSSTLADAQLVTNLTTNIEDITVQKCISKLDGENIIDISGTSNVVEGIHQIQAADLISNCLQSSKKILETSAEVSTIANQRAKHISTNPLAFISDIIGSIGSNIIIVIILIIVMVIVISMISHSLRIPKIIEIPSLH